jgi:TRAP-type C4-dicarboxylate transport system substrate-binding protein
MSAVTEASEGKITFDYYDNATLHPATEALSALSSGLTDVTFVNNLTFPDQLPISAWNDIVIQTATNDFGYPNSNIAGIGQQVVHYSDSENVARAEAAAAGFFPFMPMLSGPAALHCREPFETPEDLEGRQIRIPTETMKGENEALGMVGVFLAPNEQYEALQRGVIDCAVNATTTVLSASLLEVAPYVAFTNNAPSSGANWAISTGAWDQMAPEVQEVLLDARYAAYERFARDTLTTYETLVDAAEEAGGSVVDAGALNPAIAEYWAERPSLVDSAPEGVEDPEAAIARTNAIADAWWGFTVDELGVPAEHEDILEVLALGDGVLDEKGWASWTEALQDNLGAD